MRSRCRLPAACLPSWTGRHPSLGWHMRSEDGRIDFTEREMNRRPSDGDVRLVLVNINMPGGDELRPRGGSKTPIPMWLSSSSPGKPCKACYRGRTPAERTPTSTRGTDSSEDMQAVGRTRITVGTKRILAMNADDD